MKLIGIPLRKPSFNEVTVSVVMAVGLWLGAVGLLKYMDFGLDRTDAGALLVVLVWACVGTRVGIRVDLGHRHLAANVIVSALLLGLYQAAWALAG